MPIDSAISLVFFLLYIEIPPDLVFLCLGCLTQGLGVHYLGYVVAALQRVIAGPLYLDNRSRF